MGLVVVKILDKKSCAAVLYVRNASGVVVATRALSIGFKPLSYRDKMFFAAQRPNGHLPAVNVAWEDCPIDQTGVPKTSTAPGYFDEWYLHHRPSFAITDDILRGAQQPQGTQVWHCDVGQVYYAAYGEFR
jgi:hypothetical protein